MIETEIAGESVVLLPDGSMAWPSENVLFVADLHLGKEAAFRASGVPIPGDTSLATLQRLGHALTQIRPARLIVLGDLWHARAGMTSDIIGKFNSWRQAFPDVEVQLVKGNHDLKLDALLSNSISEFIEGARIGPFVLKHHPEFSAEGYVLCGHIHPAAILEGPGRQRLKLPCFHFGERIGILPAYGSFTGNSVVHVKSNDRVFVLAGQDVLPVNV